MKFGKVERKGQDKCWVQAGAKTKTPEALTKSLEHGKEWVQTINMWQFSSIHLLHEVFPACNMPLIQILIIHF